MDKHLFKELKDYREKHPEFVDDQNGLDLAVRMLKFYLPPEWFKTHICISNNPHPFFCNDINDNSNGMLIYQHRVVQLASIVYAAKKCLSGSLYLERLLSRDVRTTYMEGSILKLWIEYGFNITVRKESGIRGNDYEFDAEGPESKICIEVTSKEETITPSVSTVLNTLQSKRDQFPTAYPAILYIHIPSAWASNSKTEENLSEAIAIFFRKSKRINFIIFAWYQRHLIDQGEVVAEIYKGYSHPDPRIKMLPFSHVKNSLNGNSAAFFRRLDANNQALKSGIKTGGLTDKPIFLHEFLRYKNQI